MGPGQINILVTEHTLKAPRSKVDIMVKFLTGFSKTVVMLKMLKLKEARALDIGFLNWSFATEMSETARTSLPLKITSYIRAQSPMLALGPAGSTAIRFVQDFRCGVACSEPHAEALACCLGDLVADQENYAAAQGEVKRLIKRFSRDGFFEQFEEFVTCA